jgi:hypothetical protein
MALSKIRQMYIHFSKHSVVLCVQVQF